ncbi:hypothetical protein NP233_g8626 [Leucocoprinus birnbaumii]|uniref:DUF6534 domain-containing protein n=1 Tax=Leucocoprinus birnbaumii TaxID=56174 RepID=A0AAD5VQK6_9AGAR|nr:hypothetical protein NP233_g8626 [Leucocoprinus birnbaumii]
MSSAHFDLASTYGVLLVGVLFAAFFQGILTVQAYQYHQNFQEDSRATRLLVSLLWILGFLQLVLISYSIHHYLVRHWGDTEAAVQYILPLRLHLFLVALSILLSQWFFLYRIWVLSECNVWVVGPVSVCILCTFASVFTEGMITVTRPQIQGGVIGMVIVGTFTDILIASSVYYYVRERSHETRQMKLTSTIVNRIIWYTVATTALTSLIILACMFAYIGAPNTLIHIGLHFSSGRTYANAVLVKFVYFYILVLPKLTNLAPSLNARRRLRETLENLEPTFSKIRGFSQGTSSAVPRVPEPSTKCQGYSLLARSRWPVGTDRSTVQKPLETYPARFRTSFP